MSDVQWIALAAAFILLGIAALGWMRPSRVTITAPRAMLLLGAVGMLVGLYADTRTIPLAVVASICSQGGRGLWGTIELHAQLLPWMHFGMWIGGFMAVPLLRKLRPMCRRQYCARVVQNLACSAWMTVGMSVGVLGAAALGAWAAPTGPAPMLAGMFAGMVWGMVVSVSLYRAYFLAAGVLPPPTAAPRP
jgi:hypothetical protein